MSQDISQLFVPNKVSSNRVKWQSWFWFKADFIQVLEQEVLMVLKFKRSFNFGSV